MVLPTQREIRPVLLDVLTALGGRARPAQIYPGVTARFPLTPTDLAALLRDGRTSLWQNRIQFVRQALVTDGLIDASERGIWQLTDAGRVAVQTPLPPSQVEALEEEPPPAEPEQLKPEETTDLVAALRAAATDSANPLRLEKTCASAFRFFGFDAEEIGGPGNTDVLLLAPLGVHQYTVVVDAKSTGKRHVANAQVDWLSIKKHREHLNADYACVVGPSFGGGYLVERATEFGIVLLSVDELSEILELHSQAPFALTELRLIFEATPLARAALPRLRAVARDRRRFQLLVERVLTLIDNFNRIQPDLIVAKPETLQALALASLDERLTGTTIDEVTRVLALLAGAGVLTLLPAGGFASTTSFAGALRRLGSIVPA